MAENLNNQQYAYLRDLPTEELEQLLREDFQQDSTNQKMVDYILEVITERENPTPEAREAAVQAAWEDFQQNYNTPEGNGKALYPMFPEMVPKKKSTPKLKRSSLRWIPIAAVLTIMLMTLAPQAFGMESLFTIFGQWTEDIFYFVRYGSMPEETEEEPVIYMSENEGLMELWGVLENYGATDVDLPTSIPERFTFVRIDETQSREGEQRISGIFECEDDWLLIQIRIIPDRRNFLYEKDNTNMEVYTHNGKNFYIMYNLDDTVCSWGDAEWDCSITGAVSKEEMYQILNSIE